MAYDLRTRDAANHPPTSGVMRWVTRGLIAIFIVMLAALATYVLIQDEIWLRGKADRPARLALDLTDQLRIDPQLIDYRQIASIDLTMEEPRSIAIGPHDKLYIAGDRAIYVFSANGQPDAVINFDSEPQCLAVSADEQAETGRLFVTLSDAIKVLGDDHQVLATWPLPNNDMLMTSIAVAGEDVFVADAGNRMVWRFNVTGEVTGRIGEADAARQIPGFVIPHLNFDIVAGSEGLLYCVNPGKLQVSTYSFDGDLGSSWGRAGSTIADFFGCCNPTHIARFADGRFVTSEKGIPRIKVYSTTGELESVVAGPAQLGISEQSLGDPRHGVNQAVFDIALDSAGRVFVLDPITKTIRIFAPIS